MWDLDTLTRINSAKKYKVVIIAKGEVINESVDTFDNYDEAFKLKQRLENRSDPYANVEFDVREVK